MVSFICFSSPGRVGFFVAVSLLSALFSFSAFAKVPEWTWQNPLPQGEELKPQGLCFVNAQTGYAVAGTGGTLLKTTDGGATWVLNQLVGNDTTLSAVDFPNAQTGYVVGGYVSSSVFLKTVDGGATWVRLNTGFSGQPEDVQFPVDAQTGYVAGLSYRSISKTTDGGTSWTTTTLSGDPKCIEFPVDAQTGYVGGQLGYIHKTTDGGATWVRQTVASGFIYSLHFPVDAQTGYAAWTNTGSPPTGRVYKTTDGGSTWDIVAERANALFYSVYFPGSQTQKGFVAAHSPFGEFGSLILKTTDGGATWTDQDMGRSGGLQSVYFPDAQVGYVGGNKGVLLKTTDGGTTWSYLTRTTTLFFRYADLLSVNFPLDSQTGYAAGGYPGREGVILKTTDGGTNWFAVYKDTTDGAISFYGVHFPVSIQTGYAVGSGGAIPPAPGAAQTLKTTNAGATWAVVDTLSWSKFYSVHFVNTQTGYVVGYNPYVPSESVMRKTTDGGASWVSLNSGLAVSGFQSVHFPVDAQTGYVVGQKDGEASCVLKTTNGGASWALVYTEGGGGSGIAALFDVQFPIDAQTGYVVGEGLTAPHTGSAEVLKTTNGGSSWTAWYASVGGLNLGPELFSVDFPANAQTGYAVGSRGNGSAGIIKTTNGGTTWVRQNSSTRQDIYGVDFPPGNVQTGYVVGGDHGMVIGVPTASSASGMIRKTTTGGASFVEEEPAESRGQRFEIGFKVLPNPFTSFARISGHERELFALYDVTGRKVGTFRGDWIGEGLSPGVYFLRPEDKSARPVRIVKIR